ncbi:MAG: OsmC family protein [Bacteroidales bacterium]
MQHGKNEGPTPLELVVMGYAGCVTTIFKMMAEKLKVDVSAMRSIVNTEHGDKNIEKAEVTLEISSQYSPKLIKKAYHLTQEHCPVGVLFENSGVDVEYKINIRGSEK